MVPDSKARSSDERGKHFYEQGKEELQTKKGRERGS